jgi:plastocyanin
MRRIVQLSVVLCALAACGGDDDATTATSTTAGAPVTTADDGTTTSTGGGDGCRDAEDGAVALVAQDTQWDVDCLRAPPGALTIEVDNRDDGVNHNVHLPDAPGSPATELELGPTTQTLDVDLEAGAYEYVCDIHPNMVGTLTVG